MEMYHVSSPLRRTCEEIAASGRGCGEHMAIKALLISGNLPENRITFCYKLQSHRKPGFPRTAPLCVAARRSACSMGCQGAGLGRQESLVVACKMHRAIFQEHRLDVAGVTLKGSLPDPSAPMVTDEFYVRDNPLQNVLGVAQSRVDSGGSEQVEREGATSDPSQPLLLCRVWQAAQSKGQGRGVSTTDPLQRCLLKMNGF